MCGIIGFISKDKTFKNAGRAVVEQYQRQHHRGSRGFGHIAIEKNKVTVERAVEPTKAILDTYMSKAPIQFFHHRMPTSTDNELEQTHPMLVSHDELSHDYLMIHNGVIRNTDKLFKIHTEELGYIYKTLKPGHTQYYKKFNDSESLAIETARYFDGRSDEIAALGTIAFILVQLDKTNGKPLQIFWSRNTGNPIEMVETKTGLLIASEVFHEDAELVPEFTFEVIDLKEYFKASKTKSHKSIIKLIKAGDATYAKPPAPVVPANNYSYQHRMGFGGAGTKTQSLPAPTSSGKDDERSLEIDAYDTLSPRERAFTRMAERVIADIEVSVYDFFGELAYNDVGDDEITKIASELNDLLLEKKEIAAKKVRKHYDAQEDAELGELLDYNSGYLDNDDEEDEAVYTASVNDRANSSQKRFEAIID